MTGGDWFALGGVAIEGVGILLTAWGFIQTWREFSDERLIGDARPVIAARARARRAVGRAGALWRRVRGYPPEVTVGAGATVQASGSVDAEGLVGFPPLDPAIDPSDAIAELDQRTRKLVTAIGREMSRRSRGDAELRRVVDEVDEEVQEAVKGLDRRTERIAIGGLRTAMTGLGLVLVGLVLQGLGVVVT